jgi:hypothetical protein
MNLLQNWTWEMKMFGLQNLQSILNNNENLAKSVSVSHTDCHAQVIDGEQ